MALLTYMHIQRDVPNELKGGLLDAGGHKSSILFPIELKRRDIVQGRTDSDCHSSITMDKNGRLICENPKHKFQHEKRVCSQSRMQSSVKRFCHIPQGGIDISGHLWTLLHTRVILPGLLLIEV